MTKTNKKGNALNDLKTSVSHRYTEWNLTCCIRSAVRFGVYRRTVPKMIFPQKQRHICSMRAH